MRKVIETKCYLCEKVCTSTEDDEWPTCENCNGLWEKTLVIQDIFQGKIPPPGKEEEDS